MTLFWLVCLRNDHGSSLDQSDFGPAPQEDESLQQWQVKNAQKRRDRCGRCEKPIRNEPVACGGAWCVTIARDGRTGGKRRFHKVRRLSRKEECERLEGLELQRLELPGGL
jgi:hypothetical protein